VPQNHWGFSRRGNVEHLCRPFLSLDLACCNLEFGLRQVRPESPSGTTLADACSCIYTAAVKGIRVADAAIPGLKIETWGTR